MLVLTIEVHEKIIVECPAGKKLEVSFERNKAGKIRLGFNGSPEFFSIIRQNAKNKTRKERTAR